MHSLGNINVPSSQTALWLRAVLFSKRRSMLLVCLFFCSFVLLPCRRGRPVCLPGISLLVCFRAHTPVRPYNSLLVFCHCRRGRRVCLPGCSLLVCFGRTHRCAPTIRCSFYAIAVGADGCVCPVFLCLCAPKALAFPV